MEKKMETTIVYWGYMGIMENKMETTDNGLYRDPFPLFAFRPQTTGGFLTQVFFEDTLVCFMCQPASRDRCNSTSCLTSCLQPSRVCLQQLASSKLRLCQPWTCASAAFGDVLVQGKCSRALDRRMLLVGNFRPQPGPSRFQRHALCHH